MIIPFSGKDKSEQVGPGEISRMKFMPYIRLRDNEDTRKAFDEKTATSGTSIDVAPYSQVLKSGWRIDSPGSVTKEIEEKHIVNNNYNAGN